MNAKNMFFAALISFSAVQIVLPTTEIIVPQEITQAVKPQQQAQWKKFFTAYATTIVAGSLIGGITGKLSRYAVILSLCVPGVNLVAWIPIFIAERKGRAALVDEIKQSCEEYSIENRNNWVSSVAWVSSWIAFIMIP